MTGKFALIIANTEYTDSKLATLAAPGKDAEAFAEVLKAPDLSAFDDVSTLINQPEPTTRRAIAQFFANRKPDDLLLLYFSGHGVRDEQGRLFLATTDTDHTILDATALAAEFVTRAMDNSRSKRQILILDCCNSGAFAYGTKGATGATMGTASAFEGTGYGHIVLTATDTTQFAWEGDKIIGEETTNSLFTHFLVKGLEGEADNNGDGIITVDDLYDYAFNQVVSRTPKQRPGKWIYKEQGQIVLTTKVRQQTVKPLPLDADLEQDIQSTRNYVREAAVKELGNILNGNNLGKALSAELRLQGVAENDDSRSIARMAAQLLEEYRAKKGIISEPEKTITPKVEVPLAVKVEIPPKRPEPKAKEEAVFPVVSKKSQKEKRVEPEKQRLERTNTPSSSIFARPNFKLALGIGLVVIIGMIAVGGGLLVNGLIAFLFPPATEAPAATQAPSTQGSATTRVISLDSLVPACKSEGMLTLIATPANWANYGDIFKLFEATSGVKINSLNEYAGSSDELAAIESNKGIFNAPQASDIVDVGYAWGATGKAAGDYQAYKVSTWDKIPNTVLGIPSKDPDGFWTGGYYGVMAFEINTAVVKTPPVNWIDLLKPEYKSQVALAGAPTASNQAIQAIYAAALGNGGSLDNAQPGLDFFKKLNDAGNFVPVIAKSGTIAQGTTPIMLAWDYLAYGDRDTFAGSPSITIVYPSPTIASLFVQAISAYAPHPNCAKLWMEILHSDGGQLAWMKGYVHGVNQADMESRGVIPEDLKAKFPASSAYASAASPTTDQITAAKALIIAGWDKTVGVNVK